MWEQIDCGVLTCEQAQSVHLRRYPHIRKQIVFIYDHWLEMMRLKDDTYAFFKQCKALGNAVYLLSNIGEESHRYLKHKYDFFDRGYFKFTLKGNAKILIIKHSQ